MNGLHFKLLNRQQCIGLSNSPSCTELCWLSTCFVANVIISYNLVKSLVFSPIGMFKFVLWLNDEAFPLTLSFAASTDQGEDTGRPVARKASSTSVFILELKPTGYIYHSQTYPAQRGVKRRKT